MMKMTDDHDYCCVVVTGVMMMCKCEWASDTIDQGLLNFLGRFRSDH